MALLNLVVSALEVVGPTASSCGSVKPVSTGGGAVLEMDLPFPV